MLSLTLCCVQCLNDSFIALLHLSFLYLGTHTPKNEKREGTAIGNSILLGEGSARWGFFFPNELDKHCGRHLRRNPPNRLGSSGDNQ